MAEPGNGSRRPVAGAVGGWWFWAWTAFCGLLAVLLLGLSVSRADAGRGRRAGGAVRADRRPGAGRRAAPGGDRRGVRPAGRHDLDRVRLRDPLLLGPWPALLVHGIGVVLGEIAKRKPVWKIVFNTGQYVGCLALSALILWLAGLRPTPTHPSGDIDAHTLLVMAVSWAAYFLLNLAMVATAISLRTGTRWWDDFVDDIDYYAITTFAVLALSPVVVVVTKASWGLIPLLLLPLFLVYKTASISLEKEHAAMHDALTGLPNRKRLIEHDGRWPARRPSAPAARVALCLLDLDRFKEVNDTLGHHTGDRLLEIAASRLARRGAARGHRRPARRRRVRRAAHRRRAAPADALEAAERIRGAAQRAVPPRRHGPAGRDEHRRRPAPGAHRLDVPRLLQLRRRRDVPGQGGAHRRRALPPGARHPHAGPARTCSGRLRRAIENGELELHYQPKVSVPTAGRSGSRRWCAGTTPTRGPGLPGRRSSTWPSSPA